MPSPGVPATARRSVHVVGAGALGLGAALAFARAGWRVAVSDLHPVGHARGSSSGRSRVLRCAHGVGGERYTELARRSRERWLALSEGLLHPVGVAWLLGDGDPFLAASRDALDAAGVPYVTGHPARHVPGLVTRGLGDSLFEPLAGFLRADRCLEALRAAAGVDVRLERCDPDAPARADVTVWACGPWLGTLFESIAPVRAVRRGWVQLATDAALPVVCEPAARAYLVPDGAGVKVGPEHDDEPLDPDGADRTPREGDGIEAAARAWLATRLPGLAAAPVRGGSLCGYELTPDGHFVLAELPGSDGAHWLLGGGSGHAFKHAPALGEALLAAVTGQAAPDPVWGLAPRRPLVAPGSAMGLGS